MIEQIAADVVVALGLALIAFLWQGAAIGLITAATLAAMPRATPRARYAVACMGLLVMSLAPPVTMLAALSEAPSPVVTPAVAGLSGTAATIAGVSSTWQARVAGWLPDVVGVWAAGVLLLTVRLARGWWATEAVRHDATQPVSQDLAGRVARLAGTLGVTRHIELVESMRVDVPTVIGWLRPTILMPLGALAGLSTAQIEAVLSHELGHIRRHDYLVNSLQNVSETLLFYHPAVWWVSAQIRREREHCCDDIAVSTCGSPVDYARALAMLEESRQERAAFALAATDGPLLSRVRRLLGVSSASTAYRPSLVVAAGIMAVVIAAGYVGVEARGSASRVDAALTLLQAPPPVTQPADAAARAQPGPTEPLRVGGSIRPPRKIHDVPPVYPQAARDAGVSGVVIIEAVIAPEGQVENLRVLRSIPQLDQAAINAVRQWRYLPTMLNGEPVAVTMTVTVNFTLTPPVQASPAGTTSGASAEARREMLARQHAKLQATAERLDGPPAAFIGGPVPEPVKLRHVPPAYPPLARAAGVSGVVILRVLVDAAGDVADAVVLRSIPALDEAAIDAVRQWHYAPTLIDGVATPVYMTVTINFTLDQ